MRVPKKVIQEEAMQYSVILLYWIIVNVTHQRKTRIGEGGVTDLIERLKPIERGNNVKKKKEKVA